MGILTATGEVFCAGADLRTARAPVGTFGGTFWEKPTINSFESGMELFKPTIAAVHGPCIGYGLTGILFCDFVIASNTATFSYPEVSIWAPTIVGAIRLPPRVGWANAMELLLTGKPIERRTGRRSAWWRVVEAEELQAEAMAWARIADPGRAAGAAGPPRRWRGGPDMGWIESVRFGEVMRKVAARPPPGTLPRAAVRAWAEKRPPERKRPPEPAG